MDNYGHKRFNDMTNFLIGLIVGIIVGIILVLIWLARQFNIRM